MHITAQQMVTGQPPWSALRFRSLVALAKGVEQHRIPPIPSCLSGGLQCVLERCFTWAPADRPTARALLLYDFCRSAQCEECVGVPACDDYGCDAINCGSSCSGSRRSSVFSDVTTATRALSSSISSECSSDGLSPSNWANCTPTRPLSDISVAVNARPSAVVPTACWSESILPTTTEAAIRNASPTTKSAAVGDSTPYVHACESTRAVERAGSSFARNNPFAGRTRVTASVQLESVVTAAQLELVGRLGK
jgi:serine/threonine protein kinase